MNEQDLRIFHKAMLLAIKGHSKNPWYRNEEPLTDAEKVDFKRILSRLLYHIKDRRRRLIICLRYGLYGYSEHTRKEVGNKLGVSSSRIAQLERMGLTIIGRTSPDWPDWLYNPETRQKYLNH